MKENEVTVTREQQKSEAILRMEIMGIIPQAIEQFKEGKINCSENIGILYWINDSVKEMVAEFEKKYDCLVYHVIYGCYNFAGEKQFHYSFLYVSPDKEEWAAERRNILQRNPIAYVINETWNIREFGCISIVENFGGLIRIH